MDKSGNNNTSSIIATAKCDPLQLQTLELSELEQIVRPVLFKGKAFENAINITEQANMLRSLMGHVYIHHCCCCNEQVQVMTKAATNSNRGVAALEELQQQHQPLFIDVDHSNIGTTTTTDIVGFHDLASEEWVRTKVIPHCMYMLLNRKTSLLGTHGWNICTTATNNGLLHFHRLGHQSPSGTRLDNNAKKGRFSTDDLLREIGLHFDQQHCNPEQYSYLEQQTTSTYWSTAATTLSPPLHPLFLLDFIELACQLFRYKGMNIVEDSDWLNLLNRILSIPSYFVNTDDELEIMTTSEGAAMDSTASIETRITSNNNIFSLGITLRKSEIIKTSHIALEKYTCNYEDTIPLQYFIFQGGLDVIYMCLVNAATTAQYPRITTASPSASQQHGSLKDNEDHLLVNGGIIKSFIDSSPSAPPQQNIMLPRLSLYCYSALLDVFDQRILPFFERKKLSISSSSSEMIIQGHSSKNEGMLMQTLTGTSTILSTAFYDFLRSISPEVDINGTSDRNLYLSLLHDLHNTGIVMSANALRSRSTSSNAAEGAAIGCASKKSSASTIKINTSSSEAAKWSFMLEQQHSELKLLRNSSTNTTTTVVTDPSTFALLLRLEGIFKMITSSSIQNKIAGIMELRVIIDNVETESKNHSQQQKHNHQTLVAAELRDHVQLYHSRDNKMLTETSNDNNNYNHQANFIGPHLGEISPGLSPPSTAGLTPVVSKKGQWQHLRTTTTMPHTNPEEGWGGGGSTSAVPPSSPVDLSTTVRDFVEANSSDDNADVLMGGIMGDNMSNCSGASESNMTGPAQNLFLLHTQGINNKRPFDVTTNGYDDTDDGSTKACYSDDELRDDATASSEGIPELTNSPPMHVIPNGPPNTEGSHARPKAKGRDHQHAEIPKFRDDDVDNDDEDERNKTSFLELFGSTLGARGNEIDNDSNMVGIPPDRAAEALSSSPGATDTRVVLETANRTNGVLNKALVGKFSGPNATGQYLVISKIQEYIRTLPEDLAAQDATTALEEDTSLSLDLSDVAPQDAVRLLNQAAAPLEKIVDAGTLARRSWKTATQSPDLTLSQFQLESNHEEAPTASRTLGSGMPQYHRNIATLLDFLLSPRRILQRIAAPTLCPCVQLDADDRSMIQLLTSPEYLHPQLLKRFLHILHFLADYHCIDPADLHSLWDAAFRPPSNQHESIQKTLIFDLWIPLLRGGKLNGEQLVHLYGEINDALFTNLPSDVTEITEEPKFANVISIDLMIPVVLSFADAAFGIVFTTSPQSSAKVKTYGGNIDLIMTPIGLDLLWRFANEESSLFLSKDLQGHVVRHLIETTVRLLASTFSDSGSQSSGSSDEHADILLTLPDKKWLFSTGRAANWVLHRAIQYLQQNGSMAGENQRLLKNSAVCHMVLSKILSLWPQTPVMCTNTNYPTRAEIIERFDVLHILIDDLRQYCAIVDRCLISRDMMYLDVDHAIWVGSYYCHSMTIQTSLDLISLIISYEIASIRDDKGLNARTKVSKLGDFLDSNPSLDETAGFGKRKRIRERNPDGMEGVHVFAKKKAFLRPPRAGALNSSVAIVIDDDDDDDNYIPAGERLNTGSATGIEQELEKSEVIILDCETAPENVFPVQEANALESCPFNADRNPSSSSLGFAETETHEIIELLWATLMEQDRSPMERVLYCELLSNILKMAAEASLTSYVQRFSSTLLQFFFKRGGFDPSNTNCSALDLFALCLKYLPSAKHEVEHELNQNESVSEKDCDSLIGADYLWKVILTVSSDAVASRAIGLLAQIYLEPVVYGDTQKLNVVRLQSLFAAKCMEKLRDFAICINEDADCFIMPCKSERINGESVLGKSRIARILELLYVFASGILRSFDENFVTIPKQDGGEIPGGSKLCKHSHRSLSAVGFAESSGSGKTGLSSIASTSTISSTKLAPIAALQTKDCFSLLFDICGKSYDGTFNRKEQGVAWELLMLLPTDPWLYDGLFSRIFTPQENSLDSDWDLFLPRASVSPFRLLYGLQVVEVFLAVVFSCSSTEPFNTKSPQSPRNHHIHCALLDHMISILCEIDVSLGDSSKENAGENLPCRQAVFILHCVYKLQKLVLLCFTRSEGARSQSREAIVFARSESQNEPNGLLIPRLLRHAANMVYSTVELHVSINFHFAAHGRFRHSFPTQRDVLSVPCAGQKSMHLICNGISSTDASASASLDGSSSEGVESEIIMVTKQSLRLMQFICEEIDPTFVDVLFEGNNVNVGDSTNSAIAAKAVASAILRSTSAELREMACSVFQSVFLPSRDQTTVGKLDLKTVPPSLGVASNESRFLGLLINMIPLIVQDDKLIHRCSSLFQLIDRVITEMWTDSFSFFGEAAIIQSFMKESEDFISCSSELPRNIGVHSFCSLLKWTMKLTVDLPIREKRMSPQLTDYLIVGMLTLTEKLTRCLCVELNVQIGCQKEIVRHVFSSLFDVSETIVDEESCSKPQCKTNESRRAAMALLTTFCRSSSENANQLSEQLLLRHAEISPRIDLMDEWYVDPIGKDKSVTGYVGLRNLGCTCYLNSLMQQLFLIAPFCDGILSCNAAPEGGEIVSEEKNMLHELQLLFSYLSISARRDYDPSSLVSTIKGYDGNLIRLGEQQDVDEFFNLFGDRLERSLKSLPQKRLLQDIFGGQVSHIITCQDCKSTSERREDYLSLSLDVKGKSNILRSLDLYVEGEALDGSNQYFCQSCQAKRDSVKMACISALPNVLILHLKRFEFDLELMRKVKLNERCEFPLVLNMHSYTKEGLSMQATVEADDIDVTQRSREYYEYFLRGVLVHSGTADSGHYYSIARRNVSSNDEPWFCFNDSSVSQFDLSTLPDAAFGGSGEKQKFDKTYSAYLLFYQRKHIEFHDHMRPMELSEESKTFSIEAHSSLWRPGFHENSDSRKSVPPQIFKTLIKENALFLRDRMYFEPEYSSWLKKLSEMSLNDGEVKNTLLNMVKVLTYQLLDTLAHSRSRGTTFESFVKTLCICYSSNYDASEWLLKIMTKTHISWVESMLLRCPLAELRQDFVRILSAAFAKVVPVQRKLYEFSIQLDSTTKPLSLLDGNQNGIPIPSDGQNNDDLSGDENTTDMDDDIVVKVINFKGNPKQIRLGRVQWWKSNSFLIHFVGKALLEHLIGCESSWRRFDQLFEALYAFASCGCHESLFLIRCGLILRLLDVYLGDSGGIPKPCLIARTRLDANDCRPKMGDKYNHPNFTALFCLLQLLFRSTVVPQLCDSDSDSTSDSDDDGKNEKHMDKHIDNIFQTSRKAPPPPTLTSDALILIQSSVVEIERIELPSRDFSYISKKKFLFKALSEQDPDSIIQAPIKSIVIHLCFENIIASEIICEVVQEQFRDRKASEFISALGALFSLREINDRHGLKRNSFVIKAVLAGVHANIKYEKETCAILHGLGNALGKIASMNHVRICDKHFFNTLLFDYFPSVFIEEWFKRPNTLSEVRNCIIDVIKAFIASPLPSNILSVSDNGLNPSTNEAIFDGPLQDDDKLEPLCDPNMVKKRVLSNLITIFGDVRDAVESQASNNKNGSYVDTRAFSSYFETLRLCLTGAEYEKALFLEKFDGVNKQLAYLLWKIDEEGRHAKRPYEDIAKGELVVLFESVVDLHPEAGYELISDFAQNEVASEIECIDVDVDEIQVVAKREEVKSEDDDANHVSKLLEMYVTANNRSNKWYNDKYMSRYYGFLVLLADRHPAFRRKLLDHGNWRWALRAFVVSETGSDSGPISEVLLEKSKIFAFEDRKFRSSLVPFLFMHDRDKKSLITQRGRIETGAFELVWAMLQSEEDQQGPGEVMKLIIGSENAGLSQLSEAAAKFLEKLEQLEESGKRYSSVINEELDDVLKGLLLAMRCVLFIMDKHGHRKIRSLLSFWPEADDINILCHKLVTIGDEEWEEHYSILPGSKMFDNKDEIVTKAKRILTMLNSVVH